jgi:CRISPR/Cas system CMR-associated protein Cmr1 (group 7 of RAMP superfamily)
MEKTSNYQEVNPSIRWNSLMEILRQKPEIGSEEAEFYDTASLRGVDKVRRNFKHWADNTLL